MPNTERVNHADETPDVSDIKNPDVTHEQSDVNIRGIFWFIVGLGVFTVAVYVAMALIFDALEKREAAAEPPPRSLLGAGQQRLPPEPRLQLAPGHETPPLEERKTSLAEMKQRLNSYGWVNKPTGVVHIPIDEAKKLLLEQTGRQKQQAPQTSPSGAPQSRER
ncbi:MAG: hypothetical protein JMDDDDMK_02008 [Acidobacteria bacterium]|nr:hypothetical protein [Acidobacteriota bacterium]